MEVTKQICVVCKKPFQKRDNEPPKHYKKRKTCGRTCQYKLRGMQALMRKGNRCVICGGLPADSHQYEQTCGNLACQIVLALHPKFSDPKRRRSTKGKTRIIKDRVAHHQKIWDDSDLLTEQTEKMVLKGSKALEITKEGWLIRGTYELTKDKRGMAHPKAQDHIWSALSRRSVFIRAIAWTGAKPSWIIHRSPGQSTADAICHLHRGIAKNHSLCDTFYAWACSCDQKHKVEYKTIEDLPNEDGYHDACPLCGSSPIEVITDVDV